MPDKGEQITKNQHWVPQFYLKKFANKNGKLDILDCDLKKVVVERAPKSVCSEEFFYSVNDKKDDVSQQMEKEFQKIENQISSSYDRIAQNFVEFKQITSDDKLLISTFMSMQYLRGPYMRKQLKKNEESLIKQIMEIRFGSENTDKIFNDLEKEIGNKINKKDRKDTIDFAIKGEYSIKTSNFSHLGLIGEMEGFRNLFFGKKWLIYISKSSKKFITSDNPVLELFPDWTGKFFYGPDFGQRTHQFSMTPDILIVASELGEINSKIEVKRKTLFDNLKDNRKILELNFGYARFATRYCYASNKTSLQDIVVDAFLHENQQKEILRKIIAPIIKNGKQI